MGTRSLPFIAALLFGIASHAQEDCANVFPISIGYDPFNSDRIVVLMGNSGPIGWGYPSLILYNENGDTIAWAEAEYFAITDQQSYTLNIVEDAALPTGSIYSGLQLWTGFNDSLFCTWNPFMYLCPPEACTKVYPTVWAVGNDAGGTQFSWAVTDSLAQVVATGAIDFPAGGIQVRDSVCLPPGRYALSMVNTSIPGDSMYFSMNGPQWNSGSSTQVELLSGTASGFTLMEACIDDANGTAEMIPTDVNVILDNGLLRATGSQGKIIKRMEVLDAAGRSLRTAIGNASTVLIAVSDLPTGLLLLRTTEGNDRTAVHRVVWAR